MIDWNLTQQGVNARPNDSKSNGLAQPPLERQADRRCKDRFPIELEVRFFALDTEPRWYASGRTVNISSSGILLTSSRVPAEGTDVQLMMEWPAPLDGRVPLQLVAIGSVVRLDASGFAVACVSYQFRTMKKLMGQTA